MYEKLVDYLLEKLMTTKGKGYADETLVSFLESLSVEDRSKVLYLLFLSASNYVIPAGITISKFE